MPMATTVVGGKEGGCNRRDRVLAKLWQDPTTPLQGGGWRRCVRRRKNNERKKIRCSNTLSID